MKEYIKIINIIDRSGSMGSMKETALEGFNGFINEQRTLEGDAVVSTILFNNQYKMLYTDSDVKECSLLTNENFIPAGTTALYDAIGKTIDDEINKLGLISLEERPIKTLCVILTDGYENASHQYSGTKIKEMISEMKKDFNWEFVFLAANEDASLTAETIGISTNNSYAFQNSKLGITDAFNAVNYSSRVYRASVAKGQSADTSNLMNDYKNSKNN